MSTTSVEPMTVERAKQLLEEAGYAVAERPASWKTFSVVVDVKIMSLNVTEKDVVRMIKSMIDPYFVTKSSLEKRLGKPIVLMSAPECKNFNRVKGSL